MDRSRPLALLLGAKAVSDVGYALDFVVLGVFVWIRTESAFATGMLGLSVYAGGMLGGRLGHRYGGEWDRRRMMIIADLVRCVALVTLAVVPHDAQLWWLFPAMVVVGCGRSVFESTLAAAVPVLAGPRVQLVNSVLSSLKGVALIAGMGLSTVAVPALGFRGVFGLDAASYLLSATVLLGIGRRLRLREDDADATAGEARHRVGWSVLAGAGLTALLAVRGLDALGSSSHHVGLPILGQRLDPTNPAGVVGAIWMVWAAGMFVGALVLRPLLAASIQRSPQPVFVLATMVMSAGFIGVFWLGPWPAVLAVAAVAGLADSITEVTYKQSLQRLPDRERGQAFGLSGTIVNLGFAIGLVITGLAVTPGLASEWVLFMHGIPLVAALGAGASIWYRSGRARPVSVGAGENR